LPEVNASTGGGAAGPLDPGFHPEVKLAPAGLPWVGRADAIKLGSDHCEIIDYKTGGEDLAHSEQLLLYALLWARDGRLNPSGRLATHLTIVYPGISQSVRAPDADALAQMEIDLRERADSITEELRRLPPRALVSADECRFCDVKHLCADYWDSAGSGRLTELAPPSIRSLELHVGARLGPRSWAAHVTFDPWMDSGSKVVIVGSPVVELRAGSRLRVIDARVDSRGEETARIFLTSGTEVFALED
jgi:hypothetical protein